MLRFHVAERSTIFTSRFPSMMMSPLLMSQHFASSSASLVMPKSAAKQWNVSQSKISAARKQAKAELGDGYDKDARAVFLYAKDVLVSDKDVRLLQFDKILNPPSASVDAAQHKKWTAANTRLTEILGHGDTTFGTAPAGWQTFDAFCKQHAAWADPKLSYVIWRDRKKVTPVQRLQKSGNCFMYVCVLHHRRRVKFAFFSLTQARAGRHAALRRADGHQQQAQVRWDA